MTESITSDIYSNICLAQANRVIAAVDRNVLSPTYGCCDWRYWHDKMIDVPSGHDQEMAYFLALLYTSDFKGNPFHRHPFILELAKAALGFWCKLVGKSGSLDEFYPNEAQFGATAIVAWAASETYSLLEKELCAQERSLFLEGLERTANWLAANDEQTNLANHQAQAMLSLFRIHQLTGLKKFHEGYTAKRQRLFGLFHEEGWFEEYDYFDPGYQTTCLAFLARLHAHTNEESVRDAILRCLDHLKYCILPHYHFGAELGSRRTRHIWPSCFELFTRESSVARSLAVYYRTGLAHNLVHDPRTQDRYFVQQLYDYLWISGLAEKTIDDCEPLPFWGQPFTKYFPESGMIAVRNKRRQCLAINAAKGGTYSYCKLDEAGLVIDRRVDAGIAALTVTDEVLTSDFCGGKKTVEVNLTDNKSTVNIKGSLHFVRFLYPSPGRFLLFRLFTFFLARWDWTSRKFRYFLARLLMLHRTAGRHSFERSFEISPDEIRVTSTLFLKPGRKQKVKQILFGVEASSVYVPISKGFDLADASAVPGVTMPDDRDQVERTDILS